jgi:hypothetical protein
MRLLRISEYEVGRLLSTLRAGGQPPLPGAVRTSLGIGSTATDVDRLIAALTEIAAYGPRARYERVPERDEYRALAATSAAAA